MHVILLLALIGVLAPLAISALAIVATGGLIAVVV
jgi:hypothetical protein